MGKGSESLRDLESLRLAIAIEAAAGGRPVVYCRYAAMDEKKARVVLVATAIDPEANVYVASGELPLAEARRLRELTKSSREQEVPEAAKPVFMAAVRTAKMLV